MVGDRFDSSVSGRHDVVTRIISERSDINSHEDDLVIPCLIDGGDDRLKIRRRSATIGAHSDDDDFAEIGGGLNAGEGGGAKRKVVLGHPGTTDSVDGGLRKDGLDGGEADDSDGIAKDRDIGTVGIAHSGVVGASVSIGIVKRNSIETVKSETFKIKGRDGNRTKKNNEKRNKDKDKTTKSLHLIKL